VAAFWPSAVVDAAARNSQAPDQSQIVAEDSEQERWA